ncbi:MAG TPA: protein kinase [Gemmatimonadales bacterium]|nr:protein kinase [Gemmatimonadales bacterium]
MTDLLATLQQTLGDRYVLERELGGGGMSRVFVAQERGLPRRVALKVLPPELHGGVSVDRFRREIQLVASLHHPHIVPLLAAGEAGEFLFYTMPFVEGETLRARLAREKRLDTGEALGILDDVLDALAYAHRHGVLHRDIKPENILLVDGHALVTDFGVAKALTEATDTSLLTSAGLAIGTPAYMAPEQAAADPDADQRSDLYATGVLAYEMLGGRPPFEGGAQRVLAAQVLERPTPIGALRPDVSRATAACVMRCLEKEPAHRWASADDLRREFQKSEAPGRTGRRITWPVGVLVGLAAVGLVAWVVSRNRGPHAVSSSLVAVLPFSVRGGSDASYLSDGLVSLLSTSLDGAGDLHTVDPRAVMTTLRPGGESVALDPAGAATVAERLGAGLYVLGDAVEAGGRVQISASLYRRAQAPAALARGTVEGNSADVFTLVDGLTTQLLAGTATGPIGRVTRIASVTTASLPAYKAYLAGDAALRVGRADSALVAFQQAIALDTAFALAYYRLSVAAEWAQNATLAGRAAQQAVERSARLSDHDRLLLRALLATRRGAAVEAEGLYRSILGSYPDDLDAWSQLGEVLFHYGPELGRPIGDARMPFERVLYFDPMYISPMIHLARIAAVEKRSGEVDSLVATIDRLSPASDRNLEMEALRAYTLRDPAAEQRVLTAMSGAADATVTLPIWDVAAYVGDLDGAAAIARLLTDSSRSAGAQSMGHLALGYLALARGRLARARSEIARAALTDSVRALEYGTLLELTPYLTPSRPILEQARDALQRLDPTRLRPSAQASVLFSAHDVLHAIIREYLLGLVNVDLGDLPAAQQFATVLERETGPPTASTLPRDFGLEIRAAAAERAHEPTAALGFLRRTENYSWYEYQIASPVLTASRQRYLRAGLEAEAGDTAQAILLFGAFENFSRYDLIYAGPGHLHRAALYERRGNTQAAVAEYNRFLELWQDCDADFRPLVDSARAGLARLAPSHPTAVSMFPANAASP